MLEIIFVALFAVILNWIMGRESRLRLRARLELLVVLLALVVGAGYAIAKRVEGGLGAISNLSDAVPWGIWITFDLCGVALAAGGFTVAATVHLFHLKRFEPVLRPTILTSFIAYQLVAAVLVIDLGRPQRFWHPLIMWQHNSVMFEITLCLSLYTLVLALEFSPAVFEKLGWHALAEGLHRVALPIVMLGVVLSTLHQSSFGSLFLIVPEKLHALWYTYLLPVQFLVSAVVAGLSVVILESFLCEKLVGKRLAPELLQQLAQAAGVVIWLGIALKMGDLAWRWGHILATPAPVWLIGLYALEVLGGMLLPAVWLARIAGRSMGELRGLAPAATLAAAGVVLNRLNISWFALAPAAGTFYVPSWMELVIVAALLGMGILAFLAIARTFPVFTDG